MHSPIKFCMIPIIGNVNYIQVISDEPFTVKHLDSSIFDFMQLGMISIYSNPFFFKNMMHSIKYQNF